MAGGLVFGLGRNPAYRRHFAAQHYNLDLGNFVLSWFIWVLVVLKNLAPEVRRTDPSRLWTAVMALALLMGIMWAAAFRRPWYLEWREWLIMLEHIAFSAVVIHNIEAWVPDEAKVEGWGPWVYEVLLGGKVIMLLSRVAQPLLPESLVVVQAASLAMLFASNQTTVCAPNRVLHGPFREKYAAASSLLGEFASIVPVHYSGPAAGPRHNCICVTTFMQVFLGCVVPLAVIHLWNRKMHAQYETSRLGRPAAAREEPFFNSTRLLIVGLPCLASILWHIIQLVDINLLGPGSDG